LPKKNGNILKVFLRWSDYALRSAESWLIQQTQYDLWQAMQKADEIKVKAFA
jgi:plasmid maintenance system antidote protein VapI